MSSGDQAGRPCPSCKRWIPGGTEFCGFCGQQKEPTLGAVATVPSDATRCTRCNSVLDASQEFCANCGLPTGHQAPPTPPGRASNVSSEYNAWAIASFVVSLGFVISAPLDFEYARATHAKAFISFVPTAVIGLVAVTLGWIALRKFRSSPRPLRGRLLAIVGVRLGASGLVLGLVSSLLLPKSFPGLQVIPGGTPESRVPVIVPWGRTQNVTSTGLGLSTMQVMAVHNPVPLIGPPPYPNNTYFAVTLRLCAGPSGADQSGLPLIFEVRTAQGEQTVPSGIIFHSRYPAVLAVDLQPKQCEIYYDEGRWETSLHPVLDQIWFRLYYFKLTK
jgi:RNA polymerase subunit RPABC4/transcription elongation factor Spt4